MHHGFIGRDIQKLSFKGDCMKRLFAFVITMLLGASLSFAQAGGGTTGGTTGTTTTDTGSTGKKGHKGGKRATRAARKARRAAAGLPHHPRNNSQYHSVPERPFRGRFFRSRPRDHGMALTC